MNTIDKISAVYRNTAEEARQELNKVQQKIYRIGSLRLLLFVAGVAGIIYFWSESWGILAGIALITLLPFLFLMKYHNRLFHRKDYLEKKMEINEQELAALDYDTSSFDDGETYIDPTHLYTYDLDVFGPHSLFQYINRTCTQPGKHRLAHWLGKHLERKEEIIRRQEAVSELAPELKFRQRFRILGLLYKGKAADETELCQWTESPSIFRSRKLLRLLPVLVTGANLICLALVMAGILPASIYGIIWTCFVIAGFGFTGKVTKMQAIYGKKLQILSTYAALLHLMEKQPAQATLLKEIKQQIGGEKRKASHSITRLSKLMDELDQRNNVFMYVILNGLFFWELRQIMRIEAWKEQYAAELPQWLDAIGQADALCSLATFAYNHPDYIYPTIFGEGTDVDAGDETEAEADAGAEAETDNDAGTGAEAKAEADTGAEAIRKYSPSSFRLCAEGLGHPLMNRDRCVRNDIDTTKRPFFIIITGANMAGKSTYLRTVGINYLLACVGAPVCARRMEVCPARLITGLRTSDSLNDNESYFFAELKRLKLIIDKLQAGEKLFIILDEILKGTNSRDKQKGSLALIKQFMALQANGIIATHDLLLGTLADLFPDNIRNFCFEADITDNELTFSYRLRPGIAQNMNACFLMKKMGIAVAD